MIQPLLFLPKHGYGRRRCRLGACRDGAPGGPSIGFIIILHHFAGFTASCRVKTSVLHVVLQEDRSTVDHRAIKALYTKILFILTRCSRLLVTEQLNLFATEPRNHRYQGHSFGFKGWCHMHLPALAWRMRAGVAAGLRAPPQVGVGAYHAWSRPVVMAAGHAPPMPATVQDEGESEEADDSITRCHTMPVRTMADMVKQLHQQGSAVPGPYGSGEDRGSRQSKASSHKSRLGRWGLSPRMILTGLVGMQRSLDSHWAVRVLTPSFTNLPSSPPPCSMCSIGGVVCASR